MAPVATAAAAGERERGREERERDNRRVVAFEFGDDGAEEENEDGIPRMLSLTTKEVSILATDSTYLGITLSKREEERQSEECVFFFFFFFFFFIVILLKWQQSFVACKTSFKNVNVLVRGSMSNEG